MSFVTMFSVAEEKIIVVDEGIWQSDNGRISYFENGRIVSNQWFREVNGSKLGDTPNDIIEVKPGLIAIAVSGSDLIQFVDGSCRAVAAVDGIANNRHLATDGRYLYVTSYGNSCYVDGKEVNFTKGLVAKIDTETYRIVAATEVGYEPEGIVYYKDKLFVGNSGSYHSMETGDYESTVSIVDAGTMLVERTIDTGQPNLYGNISINGKYICINSPGDYYAVQAATIIMDCEQALNGATAADCCVKLDCASTYNCAAKNGDFYIVGSTFSFAIGNFIYNYATIDPIEVFSSHGVKGVSAELPGTVMEDIKNMVTPYGIYVNPYSGYIYATDANGNAESGYLYQWTPDGSYVNKYKVYTNPSHMLALQPAGWGSVDDVVMDSESLEGAVYYSAAGMQSSTPFKGLNVVKLNNGLIIKRRF